MSKGHMSVGCMQSQGEPVLLRLHHLSNPVDDGESEINLLLFTMSGRGTKAHSKNVPCHKRSHDSCFLGVFSHSQNSPHTAPYPWTMFRQCSSCLSFAGPGAPVWTAMPVGIAAHAFCCVVSVFETASGCLKQVWSPRPFSHWSASASRELGLHVWITHRDWHVRAQWLWAERRRGKRSARFSEADACTVGFLACLLVWFGFALHCIFQSLAALLKCSVFLLSQILNRQY